MGRVIPTVDRPLILVRHGESTWNAEERLQGQLDPPLSERGREQSRALAGVVDGVPEERVVCSDLGRARETAELLGLQPGAVRRALARDRRRRVGRPDGGRDRRRRARADELARRAAHGARRRVVGRRSRGARERARSTSSSPPAARGSWCATAAASASPSRTSPAPTPLHLGSPPNASATVFELGERPRLLVYGSLPDGGLPTGLY